MKKNTCDGCKAYAPITRECRRHAPVMLPIPQMNAGNQVTGYGAIGLWPATKADNWCEEFIPDTIEIAH